MKSSFFRLLLLVAAFFALESSSALASRPKRGPDLYKNPHIIQNLSEVIPFSCIIESTVQTKQSVDAGHPNPGQHLRHFDYFIHQSFSAFLRGANSQGEADLAFVKLEFSKYLLRVYHLHLSNAEQETGQTIADPISKLLTGSAKYWINQSHIYAEKAIIQPIDIALLYRDRSHQYLKESSQLGHPEAMYLLASLILKTSPTDPQSQQEILRLLSHAATIGKHKKALELYIDVFKPCGCQIPCFPNFRSSRPGATLEGIAHQNAYLVAQHEIYNEFLNFKKMINQYFPKTTDAEICFYFSVVLTRARHPAACAYRNSAFQWGYRHPRFL